VREEKIKEKGCFPPRDERPRKKRGAVTTSSSEKKKLRQCEEKQKTGEGRERGGDRPRVAPERGGVFGAAFGEKKTEPTCVDEEKNEE